MSAEPSPDPQWQNAPPKTSGENAQNGLATDDYTLPWIREAQFGNTLGARAKTMANFANSGASIGPSDLVHWGRHYGEKSSKFLHNPFGVKSSTQHSKEEDGYVGHFHFVNGLDYSEGAPAVEKYLTAAIGLVAADGAYLWQPSVDVSALGIYHDKQMVVTLCAWNIFARAEFRARLLISVPKSRKAHVPVDVSYTIYSHVSKKQHSYTTNVGDIGTLFWHELAASTLTRLCVATDDPAESLCGTVNIPDQVCSAINVRNAASRLIFLLPKGHLAGSAPRHGPPSTCGADFIKTSRYRNHLVDALVRTSALDSTGGVCSHITRQVAETHGRDFDIVICRLLRTDPCQNHTSRFLELVHEILTSQRKSCQNALILVEQARFLLARHAYKTAVDIAAQAVALLPLDFDSWHTLALCYILDGSYARALETINAFPVVFSAHELPSATEIPDTYATTYMERLQQNKPLDLRTFEAFFPAPKRGDRELASMASIWHDRFQLQPHLRHPICGPFSRTPLFLATNMELAAVDARLLKQAGPGATKLAFAAQSAGSAWSSVLDFDSKSTWGRAYDLVTCMVTVVGWDRMVRLKNATFRAPASGAFVVDRENTPAADVRPWLQSLLAVVYDDLHVMVQMSRRDSDRSALSWTMLGFLGWACKFNLRDTMSALHTSLAATRFDYYATVRNLEIYNEFVLSDVCASSIDPLSSIYNARHYTNKLIVQATSPDKYSEFVKQLQTGHFSLPNVLLCVAKLVSWNVRWYNYMPCALVTETLIKLCALHDAVVVRSELQILMKSLVKKRSKPAAALTLRGMFAAPQHEQNDHEFLESDTVMEYLEKLLVWLEQVGQT